METPSNAHRRSVAFRTTKYTVTPLPRMRTNGSPFSSFGAIGAVSEVGQAMRKSFWPSRAPISVKNALPSKCTGWMVPAEDRIKNPRGSKAASAKTRRSSICLTCDAAATDC
jgi:hypothetical protein